MKHLDSYKQFEKRLIYPTSTRRVPVKGNDIEKIIKEYAPWYDIYVEEGKMSIFRGVKHSDKRMKSKDAYLINPKNFHRESKDTQNMHNIIMDNSEYWKDYPKRSESLICTTDPHYAKSFGDLYRVIPIKKNAFFGAVEGYDIFAGFQNLKEIDDDIDDLKDLETYLENTFDRFWTKELYDVKDLENATSREMLDYLPEEGDDHTITGWTYERYDAMVKKYRNFVKYLEEHMKPMDNDFWDFEYDQQQDEIMGYEVWTDQPCLMVKDSLIRELRRETGFDEGNW